MLLMIEIKKIGGGAVLISGEKREKHDGFRTFNMHCQLMTALPLAKNLIK